MRTPAETAPPPVLHPVLLEKLERALAEEAPRALTVRDARLPDLPGKAHAVIGMRRAGKTCFLHQLAAERRAEGPHETAVYMSFDDDRLAQLEVSQLSALFEEYYRRYPQHRNHRRVTWLLDEVQLVPGWERFVRRVLDDEAVEVIVSGSSARMLSREVHTSLRGRGIETVIRPFSFREFLRHHAIELAAEPSRWLPRDHSLAEQQLRRYLTTGGFPEAQGLQPATRIQLVQSYVDAVLLRDIIERYDVKHVAALRWVTRQCLRNPAADFSVHRMHADLKSQGFAVGKDTVHELLRHLTDAFLVSEVMLATESERQRNSNPRKLYPADPALTEAFDPSGRANTGRALETLVYAELERRRASVGYVRSSEGGEVDFLARYPAGPHELIQVCADLSAPETLRRELDALEAALAKERRATARVLVLNHEQVASIRAPAGVIVQSAAAWLLEPHLV